MMANYENAIPYKHPQLKLTMGRFITELFIDDFSVFM